MDGRGRWPDPSIPCYDDPRSMHPDFTGDASGSRLVAAHQPTPWAPQPMGFLLHPTAMWLRAVFGLRAHADYDPFGGARLTSSGAPAQDAGLRRSRPRIFGRRICTHVARENMCMLSHDSMRSVQAW